MKLKNKTALETGAAGKGMGRSIALTLAREGACTYINYKNSQNEAGEISSYINNNTPGKAEAIKAVILIKINAYQW